MSIYICYYLKIPYKILRINLNNELNKLFKYNDFLSFPKNEQNFIINNMEIPKEIEINNNLLENIFSLFFAIEKSSEKLNENCEKIKNKIKNICVTNNIKKENIKKIIIKKYY